MKSKTLSVVFGMALVWPALGRQVTYENPGFFAAPPAIPPNIDADNFVNDGQFIINFTNTIWLLPPFQPPIPYEMQNVRNYTNSFGAFLSSNTGLRLQSFNPSTGLRQTASSFVNEGTIHCGTVDTTNTIFFEGAGGFLGLFVGSLPSKFRVDALDIVNAGAIDMGFESLCTLNGNNINLDHSRISMETNGVTIQNAIPFVNSLIAPGYWGLSTNVIFPGAWFEVPPPLDPFHIVTNRAYQVDVAHQLRGNFLSYLDDVTDATGSNRWVRAVFLSNTNTALKANVYFPVGDPVGFFGDLGIPTGPSVIEWVDVTGQSPNSLFLFEYFGYVTNYQLAINGFAGSAARFTFTPFTTIIFPFPTNTFTFGGFNILGTPATPVSIPAGTFNFNLVTNQNSAYEALLQPNSVVIGDNFGQTYSNSPGRVEINATNLLSLDHTRISSLNFLKLNATNQFAGSPGAKISSPYSDFSLRNTNGFLSISNLTVPSLTRAEGRCDIYNARWTNVVGTVTNHYHVLFVDTRFSAFSPTRIVNLKLQTLDPSGNPGSLYISDVLNVISNSLTLDCSRMTITANTNDPTAITPFGGFNFSDPGILWSTATPRLQYLTNNGFINALNAVFFRGSRTSPYYSSNFNEPYFTFVNTGGVTNFSSRIYATNFLNSGVFSASGGSIELHQARLAILTNGAFLANGPITIEAANLFVSNHVLSAAAPLTFTITNSLDDGSLAPSGADGITNKNFWTASGIDLPVQPANASLLGTTITNIDPSFANIRNVWSGADLGCRPAGFTNNAAIGRLILDGRDADSIFSFTNSSSGPGALYVDCLIFANSIATNVDAGKNYIGVQIAPNMKIYYSQALANGVSIAERLNGKNNGGFCWVSNYNTGFFSSTNIFYPSTGVTNRLNTALVTSCDLDSNGNGIPNCVDPEPIPILSPASLALSVTVIKSPVPKALVSWTVFPNTTNSLYYVTKPGATNWQLLTNFYYTSTLGRVTVTNIIGTNSPRFYRVRATMP